MSLVERNFFIALAIEVLFVISHAGYAFHALAIIALIYFACPYMTELEHRKSEEAQAQEEARNKAEFAANNDGYL